MRKKKTGFSAKRQENLRKTKKKSPVILFCGDVHGAFDHINEVALKFRPDAMVLLGDLQPEAPIEELLGPALATTKIWWIPGNHDTDTDEYYDRLWLGPLEKYNLHGRVADICGVRVAGLGGVFRGQVWMPEKDAKIRYNYYSPQQLTRRVGASHLWRGGLPRRHRSTIFPSMVAHLASQKADILVTHEAPSCHPKGFVMIDRLAKAMGVKTMFHGHQHEDRVYGTWDGRLVRAVGFRGVVDMHGRVMMPAIVDPRETVRMVEKFTWGVRNPCPRVLDRNETYNKPKIWAPVQVGVDPCVQECRIPSPELTRGTLSATLIAINRNRNREYAAFRCWRVSLDQHSREE